MQRLATPYFPVSADALLLDFLVICHSKTHGSHTGHGAALVRVTVVPAVTGVPLAKVSHRRPRGPCSRQGPVTSPRAHCRRPAFVPKRDLRNTTVKKQNKYKPYSWRCRNIKSSPLNRYLTVEPSRVSTYAPKLPASFLSPQFRVC